MAPRTQLPQATQPDSASPQDAATDMHVADETRAMHRREALKLAAVLPLATWALSADEVLAVSERVAHTRGVTGAGMEAASAEEFTPKFFNALEWRTVRVLVDVVIPRDARSGSATDAGVPEFMDFIMVEYPGGRNRMRTGLGWLNAESRARFARAFPDCSASRQAQILDDIAWPKRAKPEHLPGVQFFNAFRDLTATGFFTSRIGVEDLQYMGNVGNVWTGCPSPVLTHIGVKE
jgi:hypothetical protein